MRKQRILALHNLILFLILFLSACSEESTPTAIVPPSPTATPDTVVTTITPTPVSTTTLSKLPNEPTLTPYFTTLALLDWTSTPFPTSTPTLNTTPYLIIPPTSEAGKTGPDQEEQAFLTLLNNFREARNSLPLSLDLNLLQSARWLAQDMATKNYINHTDSLGRDVATRLRAFGFGGKAVGENIAGGFEHAGDNLAIWQSDDIHLNNMVNPYWTKAGVGRYYSQSGYNHWVWVLDLGRD